MTEGEHRGPTSEGEWRGPRDTGLTAVGISAARARVLDRLRSRHEAWGVPELADTLLLHRNTVREHLSSLVDAGLAEFTEIRSERPGRPARHYRATAPGGGIDYFELVNALVESVQGLPDSVQFAERTGEAWGGRLAEQLADARPAGSFLGWMDELGFSPQQTADSAIEMRNCPVLAAARKNPAIVCGIHRGLLRALARPSLGEVDVELRPWASPTGCLLLITEQADRD